MGARPHSVASRTRVRQMALDPADLAARRGDDDDIRPRQQHASDSRLRAAFRPLLTVAVFAALSTGAVFLWSSGFASTARAELSLATTEFSAWAEARVASVADEGSTALVPDATDEDSSVTSVVINEPEPVVARIVETAGRGVAVRDACQADARSGGAFREGASVTVVEPGGGPCVGWSYVEADGVESWVSNRFLALDTIEEHSN